MIGSEHAGSGGPPGAVSEPSFAERARTLVHLGGTGTLSTQSRKLIGYPFGSVAPYGVDDGGRPTFLISQMAMHTQNLEADARASLLVTQPGWTDDPLAGARVTLVGTMSRLAAAEVAPVREAYLRRHENARHWVDFDDFAFWRLDPMALYFVGGFGAMDWIAVADYVAAQPDPLAEHAAAIVAHMNADHADALVVYCRAYAGVEADGATMTSVDRLGMGLRARCGQRLQGLRIAFPRSVTTPEDARAVLIDLLRRARGEC